MNAKQLTFESIQIGDTARTVRVFTADDVASFAHISGDYNPLHMNDSYASQTRFAGRIVHGALLGSLFSYLIGMELPGEKCLYLDQTLSFKKPVYLDEEVEASIEVEAISVATRILTLITTITKQGEIVVTGKAHVQVLE